MEKIDELKKACTSFRKAIIDSDLKSLVISFQEFPQGACGDTCLILGKYLEEHGFGEFEYVCGVYNMKSHAWLEKDGVIVDITANQFIEYFDVDIPEVVVTRQSSLHEKFEEEDRFIYSDSLRNNPHLDIELLATYKKILSKIHS